VSVPSDRRRPASKATARDLGNRNYFRALGSYSPNQRSHEVRRISALRDRFRAAWRTGQCSAPPAQPSKTTKKSGRSRIGRTLSPGQVAEGMGPGSDVLCHLSHCNCSYRSRFGMPSASNATGIQPGVEPAPPSQ
jgi:hypothetical protein